MKILTTIAYILLCVVCVAQPTIREGVYKRTQNDIHTLLLLKDGYISEINFKDNSYISTRGGTFKEQENKIYIQVEYNDANQDHIGQTTELSLVGFAKQPVIRQDLDALWRITGRMQNNEMITITRGDRKTIKILVDGYFQWIAINPKEKGFYGTGGGTYTFQNNQYTENILFFSRDNSRVGKSLSFKGELKNKQWHHSGASSKGDPIHEIWSRELH